MINCDTLDDERARLLRDSRVILYVHANRTFYENTSKKHFIGQNDYHADFFSLHSPDLYAHKCFDVWFHTGKLQNKSGYQLPLQYINVLMKINSLLSSIKESKNPENCFNLYKRKFILVLFFSFYYIKAWFYLHHFIKKYLSIPLSKIDFSFYNFYKPPRPLSNNTNIVSIDVF